MTEFFMTKMGHQFYDGTMPRIAKALERLADAAEKQTAAAAAEPELGETAQARAIVAEVLPVARIARLLNGQEWDADTLDAIAQIVREAGFTIEEPPA